MGWMVSCKRYHLVVDLVSEGFIVTHRAWVSDDTKIFFFIIAVAIHSYQIFI